MLGSVIVVATPMSAQSQVTAPGGYTVVSTKQLNAGVEYVRLTKAKGPVVAHVAHVEPGAAVDLQVVNANDRISATPRDLETTSAMCRRVHCIAGVNGDFHKIGVPAGGVIVDGRMLHSPDPNRPQLSVLKSGGLVAGTFPWTGTLTGRSGAKVPVNEVNAAPPADGLAVFTPEFGPATPDSGRVELVVKASNVGALNRPTTLQFVELRTGAGPIPPDGAVLSGDGPAGQQLKDLWARRQGAGPAARLTISSPVDAVTSVGVEPVVLRDSRKATPWRDPNVINPQQPHTLIGWNKAGDVYLVAIDGRQPASEGLNMAESADFLLSLGATDAVSLDGGGGTTFVTDEGVVNRPSDNDPARPSAFSERGATNAIVLVARPVAPVTTTRPPVIPAPGAIKPLLVDGEEPTPDSTPAEPEAPVLSTPLSPDPVALDGGGVVVNPGDGVLTNEVPVNRSLVKPVDTLPHPGREATPTSGTTATAPDGDHPSTTQTREPAVDVPAVSDPADSTTSEVAAPAVPGRSGRHGQAARALGALLVSALAVGAGFGARKRRSCVAPLVPLARRVQSDAERPAPLAAPAPEEAAPALALAAPEVGTLEPKAIPTAEEPSAPPAEETPAPAPEAIPTAELGPAPETGIPTSEEPATVEEITLPADEISDAGEPTPSWQEVAAPMMLVYEPRSVTRPRQPRRPQIRPVPAGRAARLGRGVDRPKT